MFSSKLYRDKNLQVIFGVTMMAVLGVYTVIPAFHLIVQELGVSEAEVGMLITLYALPGVILAPLLGMLADRYGRKRVLVPSLFLFAAAGAACALTKDFQALLILRVVQGVGAIALGPLAVTMVGDLFSGERRTEAMGLNASVLYIGIAVYPLIGGAVANLGWNYPFLLSLAAVPVGVLVLQRLDIPESRSRQTFREYLNSAWGYLKNIRVVGAFAAGIIVFIILYGAFLTYLSLYLGDAFQASPFITGAILSASSVVTAVVSSQLGRMVKFVSETTLVKIGFVLYGVALMLLPHMSQLGLVLIPAIILGAGHGMIVPSLLSYLTRLAPSEYRAGFMSANSVVMRLGQTLGPLIFALIYTYASFDGIFFYAAIMALAAAVVGFIGGRFIR